MFLDRSDRPRIDSPRKCDLTSDETRVRGSDTVRHAGSGLPKSPGSNARPGDRKQKVSRNFPGIAFSQCPPQTILENCSYPDFPRYGIFDPGVKPLPPSSCEIRPGDFFIRPARPLKFGGYNTRLPWLFECSIGNRRTKVVIVGLYWSPASYIRE